MADNEDRADWGRLAVVAEASETNTINMEGVGTCITDTLADIAHFCDRVGFDPRAAFDSALQSYEGDHEDGPPTCRDRVTYPDLDAAL